MQKPKPSNKKIDQLRDELKLQNHLFGKEAKESWENLEKKWSRFSQEMSSTKTAFNKSTENVGAASELFFDELEEGYERIKKSLKKKY